MSKKKAKLTDFGTEQVVRKLFHRQVVKKAKQVAHEKDQPAKKPNLKKA